ncbi:MAG: spore protease YyaC [Tissierellia bacterium]|nr:spore protease YyaC [Tissierellia bacterium]
MLEMAHNNYVDSSSPFAIIKFSNLIIKFLEENLKENQEIIILCIGTDRSTGDSLGPLVGYKLKPHIIAYKGVHLMGTLDEPVHAKNLNEKIQEINTYYSEALVIAIDASLGSMDKVGFVNIKKGPLKPGLGVNKNLPTIGHISITGVVNFKGVMEYMILQNTRLSLVMNMADVIAKSLNRALFRISNKNYKKELI